MSGAVARGVGEDPFRIIGALNAEWDLLVGRSCPSVVAWSTRHPVLSDCADVGDVLDTVREHPDETLLALLGEHAAGDQIAGRVVLQAMLGKVVAMALRDRCAGVDDYVGALWCLICTYPVHGRPVRVAANLALDTLKAVTRDRRWARRGGDVTVVSPDQVFEALHTQAAARAELDHNADVADLSARRVIAAAEILGLIDPLSRDVLLSVYDEGLSGRAAAERHQTSAGMIRFRCSKAVRMLAQHSASLAEAA